jgi:hypothetical protein
MQLSLRCVTGRAQTASAIVTLSTHVYCAVRSQVFTAVTMKNSVFWDVTPCGSCKNGRFGETYRLHCQGGNNQLYRNIKQHEGSYTLLRNVGHYKSRTASHTRRRHSSYVCSFGRTIQYVHGAESHLRGPEPLCWSWVYEIRMIIA